MICHRCGSAYDPTTDPQTPFCGRCAEGDMRSRELYLKHLEEQRARRAATDKAFVAARDRLRALEEG